MDLNQNEEQQKSSLEQGQEAYTRAKQVAQTPRKIRQNYRRAKKFYDDLKKIKKIVDYAQKVGKIPGAPVIIIIIILFIIIFIAVQSSSFNLDFNTLNAPTPSPIPGSTNPIPGLTITLEGPDSINNGENISYTATITYTGDQEITISDTLPSGTEFVSASTDPAISGSVLSWPLASLPPNGSQPAGIGDFPVNVFSHYGYPNPEFATPISGDILNRFKTYFLPPAEKAVNLVAPNNPELLDFIGMWAWGEDNFNTYMDNCYDRDYNPNTPCSTYDDNWQVGYGIHIADTIQYLKEAVEKMYGTDASLQQIGQKVIDNSAKRDTRGYQIEYNNRTFPNITVDQVVNGYHNHDDNMRELAGVLYKDDAIGTFVLAKVFKSYIDSNNQILIANRMAAWPPAGYYAPQKLINMMETVYQQSYAYSQGTKTYTLKITLKPANDTIIENVLEASAPDQEGTNSTSQTSSSLSLLPTDTTQTDKTKSEQQKVAQLLSTKYPENIPVYKQAEQVTGVPWQVLAGIHYREGDMLPTVSLVSGRTIGSNEPDIVRAGGCSQGNKPGQAVPLPGGGCGFHTLLDSAIYAGNELKGKNGGQVPTTFQELVKSLSYYNGGGNANCSPNHPTNYTGCPRDFIGEDDTYVMNWFDQKHEKMYIIYCADLTACAPTLDSRLGAASATMGISSYVQQ